MRSGSALSLPFTVLVLACGGDERLVTGDAGSSSSSSEDGGPHGSTDPDASTSAESSGLVTSATTDVDTTSGASEDSSSTGIPSTCGNGELDDGEGCDDSNNADGDACRADCTNAFEIAWTQTWDGPASGFDVVSDVVVDADGNSYAIGSSSTATGGDVWVRQYLPDGSEGWTFTHDGADGGGDNASAGLLLADGDLILAGNTDVDASYTDILLLRIDGATQTVEWEAVVDGPGTLDDSEDYDVARAIAATSDGGFVVAGSVSGPDQGDDVWVARYDDAGNELWSATYDDDTHIDNTGRAVLVGTDDHVYVFAQDYVNAMSTGRVLEYDADGAPQGEPQTFDLAFTSAVWTADGNIVTTGYAAPSNTLLDAVTREYDPDFVQIWEAVFDGALEFDFPRAVQVGPEGNVYVVGAMSRAGEQDNAFLVAYDADGTALWSDEYNDELDIDEAWLGVAVDGAGDVVVAGYEPVLGQQSNTFVRKYHPL